MMSTGAWQLNELIIFWYFPEKGISPSNESDIWNILIPIANSLAEADKGDLALSIIISPFYNMAQSYL